MIQDAPITIQSVREIVVDNVTFTRAQWLAVQEAQRATLYRVAFAALIAGGLIALAAHYLGKYLRGRVRE